MTDKKTFASAFASALAKYRGNNQNSSVADSDRSSQTPADRANTPIAPSVTGLIKSFDSAPEMKGLLNSYFGIGDFVAGLPGMTPGEVGQMADQLDQLNPTFRTLTVTKGFLLNIFSTMRVKKYFNSSYSHIIYLSSIIFYSQ